MDERIDIRLFDGFAIYKNGVQILENLTNTRKTKLFVAYLLANRGRAISHQELFELLWSGEDYANPATALRTLLYRFRNMLETEGAGALSGAIISRKGTYQWNKNLDVNIDFLEFDDFAKKGLDLNNSVSDRKQYLGKAIALYKGPLLPDFCSEPWLISKSASCRDKYLDVVNAYIGILKEEKQYTRIVEICDMAQNLAGGSELLSLEGTLARLRIANPGLTNDDSSLDYYNQIKNLSLALSEATDKIQDDLESDMVEQMAYLCDYTTFREIYRLQRRMQSRSRATLFLGIMDVREGAESAQAHPGYTDRIMEEVVMCVQRQLRCGDTICRMDTCRMAILFPAESYEDAMGVLERLKTAARQRIDEELVMVYRVRPLKNAREA